MKDRNVVRGKFGMPQGSALIASDLLAATLCALAVALPLSWLLTQWFASELGHPRALGDAITKWGGWPCYAPWKWMVWRSRLSQYSPNHPLLADSLAAALSIAAISSGVALHALSVRRSRRANRRAELHGTAHWARPEEVDQMKLLGQSTGIICGMWHDPRTRTDRYLRHRGVEHTLVLAPTRSGKDKGIVTPTVLTHDGSLIITDPKGETWEETAGYLQSSGFRVIRFEPSAEPGYTARFNPLNEVRLGSHRERADALDIATSWLDDDGKSFQGEAGIWAKAARPLIAAAILHVLYRERLRGNPTAHLGQVFYELTPQTKTIQDVLHDWIDFAHDPSATTWKLSDGSATRTHPMVLAEAQNLLSLAPETLASIFLSAQAALSVLYDDCVESNVAKSDFRLSHLANGAQPTALYLVYPPDVLDRLSPIFRTMIELIFHRLCERLDYSTGRAKSPNRHRMLALLNEFPALGRMRAVEAALPICAGYGVTALILAQDLQQLRSAYGGADESITAQCRVRIFYAPNKFETAEQLSKMLGTTTALKTAESESAHGGSTKSNVADHEVARPLLLPDELIRLPAAVRDAGDRDVIEPGNLIVLKTGYPPIYGKQVYFWMDPELKRRAAMRPPVAGSKGHAGRINEAVEPSSFEEVEPLASEELQAATTASPSQVTDPFPVSPSETSDAPSDVTRNDMSVAQALASSAARNTPIGDTEVMGGLGDDLEASVVIPDAAEAAMEAGPSDEVVSGTGIDDDGCDYEDVEAVLSERAAADYERLTD